jgi:hypothetical protein
LADQCLGTDHDGDPRRAARTGVDGERSLCRVHGRGGAADDTEGPGHHCFRRDARAVRREVAQHAELVAGLQVVERACPGVGKTDRARRVAQERGVRLSVVTTTV